MKSLYVMIFAFFKTDLFLLWEMKNYHWKMIVSWGSHIFKEWSKMFSLVCTLLHNPLCWEVCPSDGLSVCWSIHSLVHLLLYWSGTLFFAFASDFNVTSPTLMFSSKFPHCPCPPQHNIGSLPSSFVFCRARCFAVGLSKIVRREPGWLCQKNL